MIKQNPRLDKRYRELKDTKDAKDVKLKWILSKKMKGINKLPYEYN